MGRFIITRTAAGDHFTLQTGAGYTLATSRPYATLDACKKGIISLITNAPTVPVVDLTAGERGPNPKFEIASAEEGFVFSLKSANGKAVVTSNPYATRKACLRAITMLREGVREYSVLFAQGEELLPVTMKLPGEPSAPRSRKAVPKKDVAPPLAPVEEASATLVEDIPEEPPVELPVESPVAPAPAKPAPRMVRVRPAAPAGEGKRLSDSPSVIVGHAKRPSQKPPRKRSLLDILLKK